MRTTSGRWRPACPATSYVKMVKSSGIKVGCVGVENNLIYASGDELERLLEVLRAVLPDRERGRLRDAHDFAGTQSRRPRRPRPPRTSGSAGELARKHELRLALEFNSRHPVLNRIEVAREIIQAAGVPNCGILLDAYHMHFSGAVGRGFEEVPAEEIIAFQFSDAPPGPAAEGSSATDRLPPGKGVVDWKSVFGLLNEKGYGGYIMYEAPNPAQWKRSAEEVAREGINATRELIASALES